MAAWSYSSLTAYETCPRRYYLTRVAKIVKEPQTPATLHGNEVHKALELHVKGTAHLPQKYSQYLPIVDKLRMAPGEKFTEYKFALTRALKPTTFFGKDTWLRGVLDLGIVRPKTAIILDYKTGKRKFDVSQLELFAASAFALFPHVETVKTGYVWLQDMKVDEQRFTADQAPVIWQGFAARVHRLEKSEETDQWPARPSGLCREWCPVGRRHCDHCGKE